MPGPVWTPEQDAELLRRAAAGETWDEISEHMGRPSEGCRKRHEGLRRGHRASEVVTHEGENVFQERADGTAYSEVSTSRPVKSLEDAIAAAAVDLSTWYVDRWEAGSWTVPMKVEQGQTDRGHWKAAKPIQTQQYKVRLWLKRLMPRSIQLASEAIFARMEKHAPKYAKVAKPKKTNAEPFLGVISLFDAHFGKLCWAPETGDHYDLKIAESLFRNAVEDLLAESAGRAIEQWLIPLGQDFYHIDGRANQTTAGTPQDTDGRYAKIIESGEMAVIWAVERLMQTAPVHAVYVAGNHDMTTSYHLSRTVAAWFRCCDRVQVDTGPSMRKYVHYGSTLLGLTHGNEEKPESLPALMATEKPAEWAASTCREWLLGHMHRSRQWQTKPVDTHDGTTVRVLRSLAGTDAWHARKGFLNTQRAAEVYYYGKQRGYAGHAVVPARV